MTDVPMAVEYWGECDDCKDKRIEHDRRKDEEWNKACERASGNGRDWPDSPKVSKIGCPHIPKPPEGSGATDLEVFTMSVLGFGVALMVIFLVCFGLAWR